MIRNLKSAALWAGFAVAMLGGVGTAAADVYGLHDGESGPVDFVAVTVVSGDLLDTTAAFRYDPNFSSMATQGWTLQGNTTTAYATFASTGSLDFDVALTGTFQTANANLMLYGFSGDTQVFRETMVMGPNDPNNGGGNSAWDAKYLSLDSTTRQDLIASSSAPEPASLGLLGLGVVAFLSRRRRV